MSKNRVICSNCQHYHITWDVDYPFGCKRFGLKSRYSPSMVVSRNSGLVCLGYVEKSKEKGLKEGV